MASRRRWKTSPVDFWAARERYDALPPLPLETWTCAVYTCVVHGAIRESHMGCVRTTCQKKLLDITGVALAHCDLPATVVVEKTWLR